MRYLLPILVTLLFLLTTILEINGQSCLQGVNVFANQEDVDNFLLNFPDCTIIAGDVEIEFDVENLNGFQNIEAINGNFLINGFSLIDISGLSNLQTIGGDLEITSLESEDLIPLSNLSTIGGSLNIELSSLTSLSGLENLINLGGGLRFFGNDYLSSIGALNNLDHTTITEIVIAGNVNLSFCSYPFICNYIADAVGPLTLGYNGTNCSDIDTFFSFCGGANEISGQLAIDFSCNEMLDADDILLPNYPLALTESSSLFSISSTDGQYFNTWVGNDTVSFEPNILPGYSVFPDYHTVITGDTAQAFNGLDFWFCPDSTFVNLRVSLSAITPPRPGFQNTYQICVENRGSIPADGILELVFEDSIGIITIIEEAGGAVNGHSITWNLSSLPIFASNCFEVIIELDPSATLGNFLSAQAHVATISGVIDTDLADNTSNSREEIVGSFDPNDKNVSPMELDHPIYEAGTELEYLIRFQNTGTFPATFVEVLDTFSLALDLSTFKMLDASHDYEVSFSEYRTISWRFDDINLPDSTSNELESHGFIKFSIQPVEGLDIEDIIANRAGIYFDFNEPVITNFATTTIVVLPVNAYSPTQDLAFKLYPNPSNGGVIVKLPPLLTSEVVIDIILLDGRLQKQIRLPSQTTATNHTLRLDELASGIYLVRLSAGGRAGVRKLVVHQE